MGGDESAPSLLGDIISASAAADRVVVNNDDKNCDDEDGD